METDKVMGKEQRWLSVQQAAAYLGCSRNFLDKDRISRLHGIPFTKLGRHIRYDRVQLDAFMEAQSEDGPETEC